MTRTGESLVLVLTRRCDLRCTYCPTVKTGLPDLDVPAVREALLLFERLYGAGEVKLFGGEPLLVPDLVQAALDGPASLRVQLSTNGTHLTEGILAALRRRPGSILQVSLDGPAEVHDGQRRGPASSYEAVVRWLPRLLEQPGFVVTQTIAPSQAKHAAASFRHLRSLGIRRFNLLPGYYVRWAPEELQALEEAFAEIGRDIAEAWAGGERIYLRNLFVRAPLPFYNAGMVVDVDRRIHPTNVILARPFEALRPEHAVGTLDHPPTVPQLRAAAERSAAVLRSATSPDVWAATTAVDAALTRLCNRLYRPYLEARAARVAA